MKYIFNKKIVVLLSLIIIFLGLFSTRYFIKFEIYGSENEIINLNSKYIDKGVKVTFFGKRLKYTTKNNINTKKIGDYYISYKARNIFGISRKLKRKVTVQDKRKPKITLKGEEEIILDINENYIEKGATAVDNSGLDITNKIIISNNIDKTKYGEYKVVYEVSDKLGNKVVKIRKVIVKDKTLPEITLIGDDSINVLLGKNYEELGYKATDNIDGDITKNVEVTNNIDTKKIGNYEVKYKVKDSSGNIVTKTRKVNVVNKLFGYKDEYDKISNKSNGWWSGNKFDYKRPEGAAPLDELKKYDAYFLGPDEKIIYLTYDEGSNDTYLPQIIDVLNKNDVKATFFLCRNYMKMNEELIKKMAESGHSIGNHTYHHYNMPSLATRSNFDKYVYEIKKTEETYEEITGKKMDKVYREPKGEWSYRSLQIVKDMGYKSFFYSANYMDYGKDLSKSEALNMMLKRYHNGAIYLFHGKNKGNYEALDDFIKEMKKKGYKFDLVKNINY